MLKKFIPIIIIFLSSCSPTFQIKPSQEVTLSQTDQKTSNNMVEIQAGLLSEDQVVEIFDANLFLARVIPIQITITNLSQQPIIFSEKDFSLIDSQGKPINSLKAKDALESLLDYYKIRAYNPYSYEKMQANFLTHSIVLKETLMPNEKRSGLLYFKVKKNESFITKGLNLVLRKKTFAESLRLTIN